VIERFNIRALLRERADQRSFHVVSEQHVRIEFRNMSAGNEIGPFSYEGDVVATCYAGEFRLEAGTAVTKLGELDQAVVISGTLVKMVCESPGTLQLIWTPPQARTTQERAP
jgi:hypothetical protein